MMTLSMTEQKSFEQIAKCSQKGLKQFMSIFLKKYYDKVEVTKDYIIAHGDCAIGLVAHMDTVFNEQPKEIFYDKARNVMWSPQGLGADDRAGVFAIIKVIEDGYRPHIILTTDEEVGGLGADRLVLKHYECPFKELKYLIQLDRRGANDCVFYDCYNKEFIEYIESFDFVEAWGTFSDISTICPMWQVCGVNLSIGYEDEHQKIERLYIGHMYNTIKKVKRMLDVPKEEIPEFAPLFMSYYGYGYSNYNYYDDYDYGYYGGGRWSVPQKAPGSCSICKKPATDLIALQMSKTKDGYCCYDCLSKVEWCENCGECYIPTPEEKKQPPKKKLCYTCKQTNFKGASKLNVRSDAI